MWSLSHFLFKFDNQHRKGCLTITSSKPRKSGSFVYWEGVFFFFFEKGLRISRDENHVINIWKYKKEESSSANLPNENKKRKSK